MTETCKSCSTCNIKAQGRGPGDTQCRICFLLTELDENGICVAAFDGWKPIPEEKKWADKCICLNCALYNDKECTYKGKMKTCSAFTQRTCGNCNHVAEKEEKMVCSLDGIQIKPTDRPVNNDGSWEPIKPAREKKVSTLEFVLKHNIDVEHKLIFNHICKIFQIEPEGIIQEITPDNQLCYTITIKMSYEEMDKRRDKLHKILFDMHMPCEKEKCFVFDYEREESACEACGGTGEVTCGCHLKEIFPCLSCQDKPAKEERLLVPTLREK